MSVVLPKPARLISAVQSASHLVVGINKSSLSANESLTIQLKISGNGNMKMIKTPTIKFPADFEVYEPKVINDFTNTTSGVTGTKTIEYLAIPRHAGKFTIPAVTFSYFDVASQSYKTLSTSAYELNVEKGTSTAGGVVTNFTNQEQVRLLGSDIRYIAVNDFDIKPFSTFFVGTWRFWFWIWCPLLITLLLVVFFRKKAKENADIALMRNKHANKVARKRLKVAAKNLKLGNKEVFYDEVLKALWGYVSDKLAMPIAELNKENIAARLQSKEVTDAKIKEFIDLLNDCEFARYAPADDAKEMDNVYSRTMALITEMEQMIKMSAMWINRKIKLILAFLAFLVVCRLLNARRKPQPITMPINRITKQWLVTRSCCVRENRLSYTTIMLTLVTNRSFRTCYS